MLELPELDDESFSEITARAVGRLPSLCSEWTDFNAHDPGITLIELFAWYKEMQQYHLDQITREDLRVLLKLLNVYPRRIRETHAHLLGGLNGSIGSFYPGQPLFSAGGVPFELDGRTDFRGRGLARAYWAHGNETSEVTELFSRGQVALRLEEGDTLLLGLRGVSGEQSLRLWFWISEDYPVSRNAFEKGFSAPRELSFTWTDGGKDRPLRVERDETRGWALSGGMTLSSDRPFREQRAGNWESKEVEPLVWLRVRILRAGCEEAPALLGVCAEYTGVVQRETKVETYHFAVSSEQARVRVQVCSWLAQSGQLEVMVRQAKGWKPIPNPGIIAVEENGLRAMELVFDIPALAAECPNVRVICTGNTARPTPSTGLPGQRIPLLPSGEKVALSTLRVMCREGEYYHDWRYVDSLMEAGSRDRVFTLEGGNTLVFGDNQNGAAPEADSLLIAGLAATLGEKGQLPPGQELLLAGNEKTARALGVAAGIRPGRDWEPVELAAGRLRGLWDDRARTVTAADYERVALQTPGRRVAAAKAIPFYEPGQQFRSRLEETLTVVVVPYSERERPMPDESFLESVRQQMERFRTICTRVIVTAPLYVPMKIQAEIVCAESGGVPLMERARDCLSGLFGKGRGFGGTICRGDVIAALGGLPEVAGVKEAALYAVGCRHTDQGDILLPAHALPWLETLELREVQR